MIRILDHTSPVGGELGQGRQLGAWRDVGQLSTLQRRAGKRLRHQPHLLEIRLRFFQEPRQLPGPVLHEP